MHEKALITTQEKKAYKLTYFQHKQRNMNEVLANEIILHISTYQIL